VKPSVSVAEHVVGNVFRTRVFPMPKNGVRILKVTYLKDIRMYKKSGFYSLPIRSSYPIKEASFLVNKNIYIFY